MKIFSLNVDNLFDTKAMPHGRWEAIDEDLLQKVQNKKKINTVAFSGNYQWQEDVIHMVVNNDVSLINSPTGSGKSNILMCSAAVLSSVGFKTMIICPRQSIVHGFLSKNFMFENKEYIGNVSTVSSTNTYNSINNIKTWLLNNKTSNTMVTTIPSFLGAFNSFSDEEKNYFIENIAPKFWIGIDEFHHAGEEDTDDNTTELGKIVKELLTMKIRMVGCTATYFRNDDMPLFPGLHFALFDSVTKIGNQYVREFIDHFSTLNLDSFTLNIFGSDLDPMDDLIANIQNEPNEVHLVCIPALLPTHAYCNESWKSKIRFSFKELFGDTCIDLLGEDRHDNLKKLIKANCEYEKSNVFPYKVILSCDMVREGTDIIPASRLHDLAPSKSEVKKQQTIGRVLRRDPWGNKHDAQYNVYFANFNSFYSEEQQKQLASDFIIVAMVGLLTSLDYFEPPTINQADNNICEEVFNTSAKEVKSSLMTTLLLENGDKEKTINTVLQNNNICGINNRKRAKKYLEKLCIQWEKTIDQPEKEVDKIPTKQEKDSSTIVKKPSVWYYYPNGEVQYLSKLYPALMSSIGNYFGKYTEGIMQKLRQDVNFLKSDRTDAIYAIYKDRFSERNKKGKTARNRMRSKGIHNILIEAGKPEKDIDS
jgi:superfamily II DNA or RNA helicase